MLSQFHGDSISDYPSLLKDNLKYREKLIEMAETDDEIKQQICRLFCSDPIWAVNTWFWTFDPRNMSGDRMNMPKDMPFIFYNYQHEFFAEVINKILINPDDVLIDKSRDMGATWLVLAAALWCWLTIPNFQALLGSRIEPLVDNWMIDSHFGKLRYMLKRLPPFLVPADLRPKIHDTKLNLYNPSTGGSIQGGAASTEFSRQGRYNMIMLDEFASWDNDKEAWTATADSSPCRIVLSTPKGLVTQFGVLRFSKTIQILSFHWPLHPHKADGLYYDEKNKPRSVWYDNECRRRNYDRLDIAQELDIDYGASGRPIFDIDLVKKKIEDAKLLEPEMIKGDLRWRAEINEETGEEKSYAPKFNERGICTNKRNLAVDFVPNERGSLLVFKYPDDSYCFSNRYFLCSDCAEGLEQGDWDVTAVYDRSDTHKIKTIAQLRGHWSPHQYAMEIAKLGVYYGYCPAWIEKNNMGHAVIEKLFEIYPYVGHEKYQDTGALTDFSEKLGWVTNQVSKPIMIDSLDKMIRNNELDDPFIMFWEECITFVKDAHGKMSAQNKGRGGKFFDDIVISRAIMTQAYKYLPPFQNDEIITEEEEIQSNFDDDFNSFVDYVEGIGNMVEEYEEYY